VRLPYEPAEVQFVQLATFSSVADALSAAFGPVPQKKLWTFQVMGYFPGVAETRIVWWNVVHPNGTTEIPVSVPQSIALSNTRGFPLLLAGDEFALLPGQWLQVRRDAATAGSQMFMLGQYIETDVPLFSYTEPQEARRLKRRATGLIRSLPTIGGRPSEGGFVGSRPGDIDGGGREK
jgi:hypothetical protein